MVERIVVPAASAGGRGGYYKLKRINGHDLGIVGVALCIERGGGRLTVGPRAPTPVLIEGLDASLPPTRMSPRPGGDQPDQRRAGTKEYRAHMVEGYVRRLLDEVRS